VTTVAAAAAARRRTRTANDVLDDNNFYRDERFANKYRLFVLFRLSFVRR